MLKRMIVKRLMYRLAVAAMLVVPVSAMAQTSSINAFSPYSMYGIGELQTPGVVAQRSMGGVGLGMRSSVMVNPLNPAAYSLTPRQGFLFDFGVEGVNFYNRQQKYADGAQTTSRTSYNTFNFHDIAFQLPLARRLGLGFSLTPYSSVGYRVSADEQSDDVWGNIGRVQYLYAGEGDLTEVKLGIGWEVVKRVSIGVAAQYYWGDIERTYQTVVSNNIVNGGSVNTVTGTDSYGISRIKMQLGLQADLIQSERQVLTLGATYDMGGNLRPSVNQTVVNGDIYGTVVRGDTTRMALKLPVQLGVGLYYQNAKIAAGVDYIYQNWENNESPKSVPGAVNVAYKNTNTVKLGFEYTPNRMDIRNYLKRWSYRVGFRYGTYYQTFEGKTLSQYAVTAGFGMPVRFLGRSSIDFGVEFGQRGNDSPLRIDNRQIGRNARGTERQHLFAQLFQRGGRQPGFPDCFGVPQTTAGQVSQGFGEYLCQGRYGDEEQDRAC